MHFVQTCESCSSVDLRRKTHIVKHPIVPEAPMDHCQLDCVTYTKDIHGNSTASNMIDLFSKFVHAVGTYSRSFTINSNFASSLYF